MTGQPSRAHVAYEELDSPLGPLTAASTPRGLAALAFRGEGEVPTARAAPTARPGLTASPAGEPLADVRRQVAEYFAGSRRDFDLPLDWSVTGGFTREVLQAVADVPYGSVTTYAALAAAVGRPKAARAVGNALGANPLAILVPCHRVVRGDGALGGYTSGPSRKAFLLRLEGSRAGPAGR